LPFLVTQNWLAVWLIIGLNGARAFMANLSNPAWTALVADIVPEAMRGRYLGSRNMIMGLAALVVAPLAGRIISVGNRWADGRPVGYQMIFGLAFCLGMVATFSFQRLAEPASLDRSKTIHHKGDLRRTLRHAPAFVGFVISAFVFNMSLQLAAPFFNVYLVKVLGGTTSMVGVLASVNSFAALFGQRVFGRLLDRKGDIWVQLVTGLAIPILPVAWIFYTSPWQVTFTNLLGGFSWAGYNLANFNLLLRLTPEQQRPRAVALYQTAVFSSAVLGPIMGGHLADAMGFRFVFALSGSGRLLGILLFWFLTVRLLRREKVADPGVAL